MKEEQKVNDVKGKGVDNSSMEKQFIATLLVGFVIFVITVGAIIYFYDPLLKDLIFGAFGG